MFNFQDRYNKQIAFWLFVCATVILTMILLGGVTRLTHSGLSMVEWQPLIGIIPPLNEADWQQAFHKYQQFPEYQKINHGMDLEGFKMIFMYEYLHRLLGRFIGVLFLLPLLFFYFCHRIPKGLTHKLVIIFLLGGLQGLLGWYMVKSGLVDQPDVSHFRLAAHLTTAFITFAYTFWVALDLIFPERKKINIKFRNLIRMGYAVLLLQIIYGAFVAGLDAGFIHNHWPMMSEGKFIHETVWIEQSPVYKNFIEGKSGVQFVHRTLAYVVVIFIFIIWYRSRKMQLTTHQTKGVNFLLAMVGVQFILGVLTIIYQVPVWLGVTHQVGAFFLLSAMTFTLHRFSK